MTRIHRWLPATSLTFGLAASGLVFIAPTHAQQAEPEPTTELVNETTEWNYLDDGNDPSNQASTPTAWTATDFDDSDWNSGQGSFGAHAGEATALEGGHTPDTLLAQYDADGTNTEAFFFRANFTVDAADLPDNAELTGSLIFDDAAVIYINGQRVTGFNDEQLAVSDDGEDRNMVYGGSELGAPAQEEFTVPADVLQAGQNTIAVQLHQASEDSSDVYFQFDSLQLTSSDNATDVDSDTDNAAEDTAAQTAEKTADDTSETPAPEKSETSSETAAVQPTALADGQQWSYLDNGTDPANGLADRTDWTAPEFDDSGWDTAAGSFGALRGEQAELSGGYLPDNLLEQYYPDTDELNKEAFFFRTDVTIDDADLTQDTVLRGSLRYDDAAIVYVNGERIEGFHDGGLDFSEQGEGRNMVYGGSNSSAPNQGEFIVPNEHLKAGANTIAVQLHQGRDSSSDIYFELEHLDFDEIEATGDGQTSILLGMGADATERRLSWFTDSGVDEMVQLTTGTHKTMPDDADTIEATEQGRSADFGRDYVHATLADLTPGTYSYRVGSADGGWSDIAQFQVFEQDLEHSFTFFGDPQIGASGNVANDGQGWQEALDANDQLFPDSQFLLSAGDQINNYIGSVDEYQAYLAPEQMRSNAFAQTLGNHDSMSGFPQRLYHQHYNQPNLADYDPSEGTYWFKHNGVLHLNISTEYRNWDDHRQFLETTIAEHGDDAHWTMLTFHRPLYSVASHSTSGTTNGIRDGLGPIINDLDIDVVLTGHDHSYSRSFLIDSEGNQVDPATSETIVDANGNVVEPETALEPAQEADTPPLTYDGTESSPRLEDGQRVRVTPQEGETLFVTANSASGSKYYGLRDASEYRDGFQARFRDQQYEQNITGVDVGQCTITANTVELDGSVVDTIELLRDHTDPEITAATNTVERGAEFDPLAGIEITDDCATLTAEDLEVEGEVDTAALGDYPLTYRVADDAGNETTFERVVAVAEAADSGEEPTEDPSAEPSEEPTSEPSDEPTPTVPGEDGSDDEPTDGTTDGSGNADSTDGKQDDQTSGVAGSGSGPGTDSDTNAAASDQVTDSKDSSGWLANTGANIGWIAALGGLAIAAGMAMLIAKRRQQM